VSRGPWAVGRGPWAVGRGPWAVGLRLKRFLIIFFDNGWNVSNSCLWFDLQSLRG
jgi:hypothetical protein